MTSRILTVTAAAALILGVSACNGSEDTTTSTSTAPVQTAPTTTTSSASTTTSSTTSSAPTGVDQAEEAVTAFYKEMDQLGHHTLDINDVTTWTVIDSEGKDTRAKWSTSLGNLVYGQKLTQLGDTVVTDVSAEEVDKPKSDVKFDAAYEVQACVDRTGVSFEDAKGKPVTATAGPAEKTIVTHLVIENKDQFRVVRDEPGESC